MKIFITGATGFVGSHLAEKLIDEGHDVYSLVRNKKKIKKHFRIGTIIEGNLSHTAPPKWIEQLPVDLDFVIHIAGIVHAHRAESFNEVNNLSTQMLYKGLKARYQKLNFVFISSLASSGPSDHIKAIKESDQNKPVSEYGKSKNNAENFLLNQSDSSWSLNIIRPPMVIGPRDLAVLDIFKMVKKRQVVYPGLDGLKKEYSFVCVFDLIDVISKVTNKERNKSPQTYFASYPQSILFEDLIHSINKQIGEKKLLMIPIPNFMIKQVGFFLSLSHKIIPNSIRLTKDKANELKPISWTCDSSKSINDLNMDYKWCLDKTIKVTLEDYKAKNLI